MLNRIEHQFSDLTRAEQRVARWVLDHPQQAAGATLAEVAKACDTSQPTVIRFCRHIGLDGFREFTLRLAAALSQPASYVHRDVVPDDSIPDAVAKVMDAAIQTLVDTRRIVVSMPLERAVSRIQASRQITFAGLGASGYVAQDASHKFFRLGIPCTALADAPSMLQFAAISGSRDVLLFVSAKGAWSDAISAAQIAAQRGAYVIALTDPKSPLAEAATLVLGIEPLEDTGVFTPMSSRLAQLAVLDALHVALALALGDRATANLRASKQVIVDRNAV